MPDRPLPKGPMPDRRINETEGMGVGSEQAEPAAEVAAASSVADAVATPGTDEWWNALFAHLRSPAGSTPAADAAAAEPMADEPVAAEVEVDEWAAADRAADEPVAAEVAVAHETATDGPAIDDKPGRASGGRTTRSRTAGSRAAGSRAARGAATGEHGRRPARHRQPRRGRRIRSAAALVLLVAGLGVLLAVAVAGIGVGVVLVFRAATG